MKNNKSYFLIISLVLLVGSVFFMSGVLGAGNCVDTNGDGVPDKCYVDQNNNPQTTTTPTSTTPYKLFGESDMMDKIKQKFVEDRKNVEGAVDNEGNNGEWTGVGLNAPYTKNTEQTDSPQETSGTNDGTNTGEEGSTTEKPADTGAKDTSTDTGTSSTGDSKGDNLSPAEKAGAEDATDSTPEGDDCKVDKKDAEGDFKLDDMLKGLGAKEKPSEEKKDSDSTSGDDKKTSTGGPDNNIQNYDTDEKGNFNGDKDVNTKTYKPGADFDKAWAEFSKLTGDQKQEAWNKIKESKNLMKNLNAALEKKLGGKTSLSGLFEDGNAKNTEWKDKGVIKAGNGYVDLCQLENLNTGINSKSIKDKTFNAWNIGGGKKGFNSDAALMMPTSISINKEGGLSYTFGKKMETVSIKDRLSAQITTGTLDLNGKDANYFYDAKTGEIKIGGSKDPIATWLNPGHGSITVSTTDNKNYEIKSNVKMTGNIDDGYGLFPYIQTKEGSHGLYADGPAITDPNILKQTQASQGFYEDKATGKIFYRYDTYLRQVQDGATVTVDSSGKVTNSVNSFYDPNGNTDKTALGYVFFEGASDKYKNTANFEKTNAVFKGNLVYEQKGNMGDLSFSKEGKQTYVNGGYVLEKADGSDKFEARRVGGTSATTSYKTNGFYVGEVGKDNKIGSFDGGQLKVTDNNRLKVEVQQQPIGQTPGTPTTHPTTPPTTTTPGTGVLSKEVLQNIFNNPSSVQGTTVTVQTGSYDPNKPTSFIVSAKDCSACTPGNLNGLISAAKNAGHNVVLLKENSYQGGYSSLYKALDATDEDNGFPRTITI